MLPHAAAVNRHVGGVGVDRATGAEQQSRGLSRGDRGRGEAACAPGDAPGAGVGLRADPARRTGPGRDTAYPLVALHALLRHVIADG
jgi:hypothetical protein